MEEPLILQAGSPSGTQPNKLVSNPAFVFRTSDILETHELLPSHIGALVKISGKNNRHQTASVPNLLKCCLIFKNVANSLEPGETPNNSASQ